MTGTQCNIYWLTTILYLNGAQSNSTTTTTTTNNNNNNNLS